MLLGRYVLDQKMKSTGRKRMVSAAGVSEDMIVKHLMSFDREIADTLMVK
ncbi:MAG: hypothetical protein ACLRQA_07000 [Anaerovoracaceae bacterium]|mgnify:FL=1